MANLPVTLIKEISESSEGEVTRLHLNLESSGGLPPSGFLAVVVGVGNLSLMSTLSPGLKVASDVDEFPTIGDGSWAITRRFSDLCQNFDLTCFSCSGFGIMMMVRSELESGVRFSSTSPQHACSY